MRVSSLLPVRAARDYCSRSRLHGGTKETQQFQDRLATLVRPEEIPGWLDTPNEAFGGLKPIEVIERGEIDRLWSMIFYLESGVAS